jgi:hypothetical protein
MKQVYQTNMEPGTGNCLAACFASILEIDLEEVPDLKAGTDFKVMQDFLGAHGVEPIWLHNKGLDNSYNGYTPKYCVLIGASPRYENLLHAVVGRPKGYGYEVVHDPHPEGGGLKGRVVSVIYLGKLL